MPAKNLYRERKEGTYVHVYNKGVENKAIFNDKEDCDAFLGYLNDYLSAPKDPSSTKKSFTVNGRIFQGTPHQPKNYFNKVELIAYSLMPDHFHLLLHQVAKGSLESFIRSLCTRYSMYFNKKYKRTGSLFDGPYKSAQVKDELCMLYLTRHFHRANGLSSYAQYLGKKTDSWVNAKVVQSFFDGAKTDLLKETDSYKDFVEKYEPSLEMVKLLESISFDSDVQHLEGRDPARSENNSSRKISAESSGKVYSNKTLKPWQRIPEILTTSVIFLLLLTFGIRNVMISTAADLNSTTPSDVLSATEETIPTIAVSNIPSPTPSPTAIPTATPTIEAPKKTLTVKITDGAESVNIRKNPILSSEIIGQAKDGEVFEIVATYPKWYGIKLADESTGYIHTTYVVVDGGNK